MLLVQYFMLVDRYISIYGQMKPSVITEQLDSPVTTRSRYKSDAPMMLAE